MPKRRAARPAAELLDIVASDDEPSVRADAFNELSEVVGRLDVSERQRAIKRIEAGSVDPSEEVRAQAVLAAGGLRLSESRAILDRALEDSDWAVRLIGYSALARANAAVAPAVLERLAHDPEPLVREAVKDTSARTNRRANGTDGEHWLREEWQHARSDLRPTLGAGLVVWLVGSAIVLVAGWDRARDFIVGLLILVIAMVPLSHLRTEHSPTGRKELGRWFVLFLLAMTWLAVVGIGLFVLASALGAFG